MIMILSPDVQSRFPVPPKLDRNNPDWHDKICKVFDNSTFPIEGVQQALAFTKAVKVSEGLPSGIVERANSLELTENDHEFAQRYGISDSSRIISYFNSN